MTPVNLAVSRTLIATQATNLPTACVLCGHHCVLRVDVAHGRLVTGRALHIESTVYCKNLSRDVRGIIRQKEFNNFGNLFGFAETAERNS